MAVRAAASWLGMEPKMIPNRDPYSPRRQRRNPVSIRVTRGVPRGVLGAALAAGLMLGGCSSTPDWADPTDWFTQDEAPTTVGLASGQASTQSSGFPNLASVPNKAPKILSAEARSQVQAGLTADRTNAVYSGEKLTGSAPVSGDPVQNAAAPPAPKISSQLTAAARVPPAPGQTQMAQAQVAPPPTTQTQATQTQVAQAAGGQTQLRFPQFQNNPAPAVIAPNIAALPSSGAQLVAVIYFAHSSSRLDGKDRNVLRDVITLHRQRGGIIRVIGHASAMTAVSDQVTHDLANFEMSLKRANSVAAELIGLGANRDQVRAEARSDKQPVYHEFMSTGEAGNRRTEIFLEN